ncbi:MAG TPA: hypothetical protein VK761_01220 [Solirubrobacteraceae bacterium]|jgi:hypothetical protein|nr:hypothetical protein [Solirubrobacteraceae bacterium]
MDGTVESRGTELELTLLGGARALLERHARELPQRDDLCGAFCGALALHAAGIDVHDGEPLDQDAVAHVAGTTVSRMPDLAALPHGERGRRDYRIEPPLVDAGTESGTNCAGVVRALEQLSSGRLAAIALQGPWTGTALDGLFELLAALERPATLIANVSTRELWGSRARFEQLLGHLLDGTPDGPPPDWDVGHFVCVVGRTRGPGGSIYAIADTYPSLGRDGVHMQPRERLVRALERPGMTSGGVLATVAVKDAPGVRAAAARLGLTEGAWDNGSVAAERL